MTLDELARHAVADLVDASAAQAVGGLADLRQRRRRRALVRGAAAVTILVLVAGGMILAGANKGGEVEPAEPKLGVTNGALLGIPLPLDSAVAVLSGSLHTELPLERVLPSAHLVTSVGFSADGMTLRYYEPKRGRIVGLDLNTGRRRPSWTCANPSICSGWAAMSPDGHRVAHLLGYGNPRLEVTDLQTGDQIVRPGGWTGAPVWSPDSSRLALATPEGLSIMEPDRGPTLRLLVPLDPRGLFLVPTWSPDGTRLAYAEPRPAAGRPTSTQFQLVVADAETGRTQSIRDLGWCLCKSLSPPQVSWSPDGELIAASTITSRGLLQSGQVLVMRPDGSDAQLVGGNKNFMTLAWHPHSRTSRGPRCDLGYHGDLHMRKQPEDGSWHGASSGDPTSSRLRLPTTPSPSRTPCCDVRTSRRRATSSPKHPLMAPFCVKTQTGVGF